MGFSILFYKISNKNLSENIIEVESVDGFAMLINKQIYEENKFFDENFFLFLENDDLCKRVKILGNNIYVIKNASYIPIHLTINKYFEFEGTKNDPKIFACHPQKLFENNNDTTVLFVNNAVKLQLDQIATKYQHNEN